MTQDTKPADGGAGGHRSIVIDGWRPCEKGTLLGFFSATLPSGIIVHDLMLHQKNASRWIGLPSRLWIDERGEKQYSKLIEFRDRATADKFRDAVLLALDKHLESSRS